MKTTPARFDTVTVT